MNHYNNNNIIITISVHIFIRSVPITKSRIATANTFAPLFIPFPSRLFSLFTIISTFTVYHSVHREGERERARASLYNTIWRLSSKQKQKKLGQFLNPIANACQQRAIQPALGFERPHSAVTHKQLQRVREGWEEETVQIVQGCLVSSCLR